VNSLRLVIGRSGLLGTALTKACVSHGYCEYVPTSHIDWENESACADIRTLIRNFGNAVQGKVWTLYWSAGIGTMAGSEREMERETTLFQEVLHSISGEESLLRGEGNIVFASSAGAIYAGCTNETITEQSLPSPVNAYGRAKLQQEEILKAFVHDQRNISAFIARISNLYGPRQSNKKKQGLLSHIARSMLRHAPIHIYVPLDTIRDYIHADDAANLMLAHESGERRAREVRTVIIASEQPVCIAHIIGVFRSITRVTPRIITSASPLGDAYIRRMKFRSTVPSLGSRRMTSLHHGAAEILSAERAELAMAKI
jgi:UDP-glucose 4-epimerase